MLKLTEFIVTGLYVGKSKWAPGTMGSLLAIPLAYFLAQKGPMVYLEVSVLLIFLSIILCSYYESQTQSHDQKQIVIDEVVGYLVAYFWLPFRWQYFALAFVVFRFFDIVKPYPISYIDKNVKGGLGVVLDDLAAGLATNMILQASVKHLSKYF
jgi:phosphatidylglycerophosphatase A